MSDLQAQPGTESFFVPNSEPQPQPVIGVETGLPQLETFSGGAQEQPPVDNAHVTEGAEQFPEPEATVDPVADHKSVLSGLLFDLEGFVHMSKTEVQAIIDRARSLFESL